MQKFEESEEVKSNKDTTKKKKGEKTFGYRYLLRSKTILPIFIVSIIMLTTESIIRTESPIEMKMCNYSTHSIHPMY